jgi:fumarate hydratase class II
MTLGAKMAKQGLRIEKDSMGELEVPANALWGAQTQRAYNNFPISGLHMPRGFIRALGLIKATAAEVNEGLGLLEGQVAVAVRDAAIAVADGHHDPQFPIDVFQTGSGTSTNMNANEVIAHLAEKAAGAKVHPNDHVNLGQSSNDVIPTAIHVSAALAIHEKLIPVLDNLARTIETKGNSLRYQTKTGRTHLMDAMPVRFDQEMGGWARQVANGVQRLQACQPRLHLLAQGGTAVGTGINAHPEFGEKFAAALAQRTGVPFKASPDYFESLSCQDAAVETSGALRTIAVSVMKIANDLRWMNSGPLAGIGEIALPALQPGSSIMPGKVNPVIPEAACMVAAQVMGNDTTIMVAGQSGNFQLNVMLPVIAYNLLQSIELLTNIARLLGECIEGFTINKKSIQEALERNPILITALNAVIGYEAGAAIAKKAYAEGKPLVDVALADPTVQKKGLKKDDLVKLLNPADLTTGGIKGPGGAGG